METSPVGGMALVEGVLLRGGDRWAAAARLPDGAIVVRTGAVPGWSARWSSTPLVRGPVALAEALSLGVRALLWSGDLQAPPGRGRGGEVTKGQVVAALVPGLAVTISLVFALPALAAHGVAGEASALVRSWVEGVARVAVLLAYLGAVGRLELVRRVFRYHGAEHRVVALHEAGGPRSVAAARVQPTQHGRCGTTFLAVVVAVTTVTHLAAFPLVDAGLGLTLAARLALVPLVAAVAYEALTAANARPDRPWARAVLAPGLALQRLTVGEPDDDQLEVALAALEAVVGEAPAAEAPRPAAVARAAVAPAA